MSSMIMRVINSHNLRHKNVNLLIRVHVQTTKPVHISFSRNTETVTALMLVVTLTKDPDSQHLGESQTDRRHGGHDRDDTVGMLSTAIVATATQRTVLMVKPSC